MKKNKFGISILLFVAIIAIALTTLDVFPFLINKSKLGFVSGVNVKCCGLRFESA